MLRSAHTHQVITPNRILVIAIGMSLTVLANAEPPATYFISGDPVRAVPQHHGQTESLVRLGEKLFFERRLEPRHQLACADCHNPAQGGADHESFSVKANGDKHRLNTPSLFNVRYNQVYYWSGQSYDLATQLDDAISDLGTTWPQLILTLEQLPDYKDQFARMFPDGITTANVKKALITFEKSLITPNARFDKYLSGDTKALTTLERQGYQAFKNYGCIACHQGINFGGNLLVRTENATDGSTDHEHPPIMGPHAMIRVPGLRNVAFTFPYFHDGSQTNLEAAINHRPHNGLQATLPKHDLQNIVLFLRTLTGEYRGRML